MANAKFTPGQQLSLDADMTINPGLVDGDQELMRFNRGIKGSLFLKEGEIVTFLEYKKISIIGSSRPAQIQPIIEARIVEKERIKVIEGDTERWETIETVKSYRVWGYNDHFHTTENVDDIDVKVRMRMMHIEKLEKMAEAAKKELDELTSPSAKIKRYTDEIDRLDARKEELIKLVNELIEANPEALNAKEEIEKMKPVEA